VDASKLHVTEPRGAFFHNIVESIKSLFTMDFCQI